MLKLAEVGPEDVVYDLGCGDGRILFTAIEEFDAYKAVGYDLNASICEPLQIKLESKGLGDRIQVMNSNFFNADISHASVVTLYLTTSGNSKLRPKLEQELKELKLGILYVGVESGDDNILRLIGKGVNHSQLVEAGRKVKEAGITLSVTVILGLGGTECSETHALETARVLSSIDPDYTGALTVFLVPGTPLHQQWQQGSFTLLSPFESLKELSIIIKNSSFTSCFFSSMHASNYLSVRGNLPRDKEKMLRQIEAVLAARDPALLRPEFLRGL